MQVNARPAEVNLNLYAGDDFWLDVTVTDPDGNAADLSGQVARADIRQNTATEVIASFDAAIDGNVINLHLAGADVAGLPGASVWDCQLAGTDTVTLVAGVVRTTAQVTI